MKFPTINNNGSDPARLIENFLDASEVLREALDLMEGSCGPHARDYFDKQPTANFEAASAEHTARLQAIIKVRGELLSLIDNVQKQIDEIAEARLAHRAELATAVDR